MNDAGNLDDIFIILDLDRTLLDTEAFQHVYEQVIRERHSDVIEAMSYARDEVERGGGSFDTHEYMQRCVTPQQLREFDDALAERLRQSPESVMNPGSLTLLEQLRQLNVHHGVLTYGNDTWQTLKMRASGLETMPYLVTQDNRKGHVLRSWQADSGAFHLPTALTAQEMGGHTIYSSIVLLDDKAVSFQDLPMNAKGYWYRPSDNLLKSQVGDVPAHVQTIRHLDEFLPALRRDFVA